MPRQRLVCLGIVLATLAVYLPACRYAFLLFDDPDYVTQNDAVGAGLTLPGLKWAFTTFHASNWHPVTWLSHMADIELFGLNPAGHHAVNVLLHAANAALLFLLLNRTTRDLWPSAMVAGLFAWHPLRVESVAWVAERKDVLSAFFWALAVLAYSGYVQEFRGANAKAGLHLFPRSPGSVWYWLALIAFALAMLAKPMAVTLPFVLLLFDLWPLARVAIKDGTRGVPISQLVLEKWPFFLLAAADCVVTYAAQRENSVLSLSDYPMGLRIGNALLSYAGYLWKMIWPVKLAVLYPLPRAVFLPGATAAGAMIGIVSVLAWNARKTSPHVLVGWLWFLGSLVPVIGLVQVGRQAMADRYTYLPLLGIFCAVVFEGARWIRRWRLPAGLTAAASGIILAGCALLTIKQLTYWQDGESLFRHAIRVTEPNPIAHADLGMALEQQGKRDAARAEYAQAVDLDPSLDYAQSNLGNLLDDLGKTDEAFVHYREGLKWNPHSPFLHCNLGTLLVKVGRVEEGLAQYKEAARLDPEDARALFLMAKSLLKVHRTSEAIACLCDARRRSPRNVPVLLALARVESSAGDPLLRNGQEALSLAQQAGSLAGHDDPAVLDVLAMALAESGRFSEAQHAVGLALQKLTGASDTNFVGQLQSRLRLYESLHPYREPFPN